MTATDPTPDLLPRLWPTKIATPAISPLFARQVLLGGSRHFHAAAAEIDGYRELVDTIATLEAHPIYSAPPTTQEALQAPAAAVLAGADPVALATQKIAHERDGEIRTRAWQYIDQALRLAMQQAHAWVEQHCQAISTGLTRQLDARLEQIRALSVGDVQTVRSAADLERYPASAEAWSTLMAAAREACDIAELGLRLANPPDAWALPMLHIIGPSCYERSYPGFWRRTQFDMFDRTSNYLGAIEAEAAPWDDLVTNAEQPTPAFMRWIAEARLSVWVPFASDYLKAREQLLEAVQDRRNAATAIASAEREGAHAHALAQYRADAARRAELAREERRAIAAAERTQFDDEDRAFFTSAAFLSRT